MHACFVIRSSCIHLPMDDRGYHRCQSMCSSLFAEWILYLQSQFPIPFSSIFCTRHLEGKAVGDVHRAHWTAYMNLDAIAPRPPDEAICCFM